MDKKPDLIDCAKNWGAVVTDNASYEVQFGTKIAYSGAVCLYIRSTLCDLIMYLVNSDTIEVPNRPDIKVRDLTATEFAELLTARLRFAYRNPVTGSKASMGE